MVYVLLGAYLAPGFNHPGWYRIDVCVYIDSLYVPI